MVDQDLLARNYRLTSRPALNKNAFEERTIDMDKRNVDGTFLGEVRPEKLVRKFRESEQIVSAVKKCPLETLLVPEQPRNLTNHQIKLFNTERRLQKARVKMEKARKIIDQRWADLEAKENELKENFILFNEFVLENVEKRERAHKTIKSHKKNIKLRQEEIDNLTNRIETIREIQVTMERHIVKHSGYQEYLEQVCEVTPNFNYISDLISRFQELGEQKNFLIERQKNGMNELEKAKTRMMKLIEEKNFVIMGLNNQIANLQARYENANIKALESEELVTQIKNNAVKQMGEIDTVKNSIWNVYVHMASSKKHPVKIKKDNVEEQMMYINRTLTELNKVNKLIKKKATKAATK
ncbi:coiled-coil domain-containing protein 42-like isoform X1 [Anthonomus grandis grandis]|uniref:coiled-coil domain-containing protein 42-like isoform X1 n=1 Tax=Anthonomus grandis grandis TaxID=2921223 RepID=UPI0021666C8D|nr:coiled-coil domain-containing protein 42-like isoform X1 [Anthonomus grandis grandis]